MSTNFITPACVEWRKPMAYRRRLSILAGAEAA